MSDDDALTLEDVARAAGVSRTSASRVFLGQGKVSEQTRRKVRAAAAKLGYVPNTYASTLASARSDMVGLLLRDAANPAYGLLFTELQRAATAAGMNLVSKTVTFDPEDQLQKDALEKLMGLRVAGLIVATGSLPSERLTPFASRIPIIRAGRPEPTTKIHAISYDEVRAGEELADYLVSLGHTTIAVLRTPREASYPEWVRAETMLNRLTGHGLAPIPIDLTRDDPGERAVVDLQARGLITAVMCPSDIRALSVMRAAHAAALSVPEDLAVTGCDGIIPGLDLIGLATYRLGVRALAQRTISALQDLLAGADELIQETIVGTLVPGVTAGDLRSTS